MQFAQVVLLTRYYPVGQVFEQFPATSSYP